MNKVDYINYLNSNHWKDFKTYIRKTCGRNKCSICGSTYKINIHHLNYKNLWHETEKDVMVLCEKCHSKFHNGQIPKHIMKDVKRIRGVYKPPHKSKKKSVVSLSQQEEHLKQRINNLEQSKKDKANSIKTLGTVEYYRRKREGLL